MPLAAVSAPEDFMERLGVRPLPPELLAQALRHASFLNESDSPALSNERLEFLGDSLLGMVVAGQLFRLYPNAGEGELTRMRADIVRGSTLAGVASRIGLGDFIALGRGEEAAGGRLRERNLAGALEAMVGAVYVAHGYRTVRALIARLLAPEMKQLHREGARIDAKSSLQHLVQARWHEPPEYVTVEEAPGGAERRFTVEVRIAGASLGRGEGSSKREAQQQAAREALSSLAANAIAEGVPCT